MTHVSVTGVLSINCEIVTVFGELYVHQARYLPTLLAQVTLSKKKNNVYILLNETQFVSHLYANRVERKEEKKIDGCNLQERI